jgi:Fe-Mn family superoxide dismutase
VFGDLKRGEARCSNAVYLHELYFANCFDPHSEVFMNTKSYMRLERDWGTFDDWQRDFVACALTAREGWAVLGYSTYHRRYINTIIDGDDQGMLLGLYPVLVIDVWSHAHYRDYLSDRSSYVIAQMREINWNVVEERIERAEKIAEALK